jgi:hypothetical protein
LVNAKYPVLVSHYRHDVIVAAEKYLDERLDGRLSELLRMELYPGPINTAVVVLNETQAGDQSIHPGAVVAGLGVIGELTPGKLTSTLAHALTMYGAECVGRERRRQQRLGIPAVGGLVPAPVTAILVGSGEGGLSLADSVRGLLRGVLQANRRLRGTFPPGGDEATPGEGLTARIEALDIIELYEDRAIEGMHVLRRLAESPEFSGFAVERLLVSGDEGQRRVRFEQSGGWWQRIRIIGEPDGALQFEAVTQAARVPARLQPTQRRLVDGFVDQAIASTENDTRLGQTLFELLVPNDFKAYAPDRQRLALLLNAEAAGVPWELMHDGFDRAAEPLSVSGGMIRQLLTTQDRTEVLRATTNTALVVGNPFVEDERFPRLEGALHEAEMVAAKLEASGYAVSTLLEEAATASAVLTALHEKPWRVLHLAAHGVFDFDRGSGEARVSGLVLGNGLFFTAAEADQLRHVPELVFINCCHLGQTRGDARRVAFHRLAANLATQFISMGTRAVVAAGWEVTDAAAATFASTFYAAMLEGRMYGEAVVEARSETFRNHPDSNTWGAYQCYGDPSFSLKAATAVRRSEEFVSQSELCVWLEALPKRAREQGDAIAPLLAELEEIERMVPAGWREAAPVCALAAAGFSALGQFDRAVAYYERVVAAERANAPVAALEQLASCRVRWAGALLRDGVAPEVAMEQLRLAEQLIRHLIGIGKTSERWSILGSVMKRRALAERDPARRRESLQQMSDAYGMAYNLSTQDGSAGDPYPLGNQAAAEIVKHWSAGGSGNGEIIRVLLEQLEQAADARAGSRTDAFSLVARAERRLLHALLDDTLDPDAWQQIHEELARGLSRGATARDRSSVRTQIDFFRTMSSGLPADRRASLVAALDELDQEILTAPAP